MNRRTIVTIGLAAIAASAWATVAIAQDATVGGAANAGVNAQIDTRGFQFNRDNVLNPILNPSDKLIERALNRLDQLPEDIQADVTALQDGLQALRDAWANDYRPGDGATLGEIRAARDAFVAEMAEQIQATKELRMRVAIELRNEIRARIGDDASVDEDTKALYGEYREIKTQLATQWKAVVAGLGNDATREDIAAARERFQAENAELIAHEKELALQIRAAVRAQVRVDRPVAGRDAMPLELQALRDQVKTAREQLRQQKQAAREEMASLSPEERESRRQEILQEMKNTHNEIKDARRQLIEDLRNGVDGDRRPED